MNISFYSGCTDKYITIKENEYEISFSYHDENSLTNHIEQVKMFLSRIITHEKSNIHLLNSLYRNHIEYTIKENVDYTIPVLEDSETVFKHIIDFIQNIEKQKDLLNLTVFEIFEDICNIYYVYNDDDVIDCDQCGDRNYSMAVSISL